MSPARGSGLVLGVETSCDETAAAVVTADGEVRSDVVHSQVAEHAPYGGIVPEIAARDHVKRVVPVVREALERAGVRPHELAGVGATVRPGLVGALLVGAQAGKAIAWAHDLPFVGVDHLVGHMLAVFLRQPGEAPATPAFPFLCLLVSGGHTAVYRVNAPRAEAITELGGTRDDAAGEAFDKVGKLLGVGYPGGPFIDALAAKGDARRAAEWVARKSGGAELERRGELSFSGLKSAFARRVGAGLLGPGDEALQDVCAAFQGAVVESLVACTLSFVRRERVPRVVLAGGVAANRGLRARFAEVCAEREVELFVPPPRRCTDNAAMIAYAGALRLAAGERDPLDVAVESRTRLLRSTRKGRGPR